MRQRLTQAQRHERALIKFAPGTLGGRVQSAAPVVGGRSTRSSHLAPVGTSALPYCTAYRETYNTDDGSGGIDFDGAVGEPWWSSGDPANIHPTPSDGAYLAIINLGKVSDLLAGHLRALVIGYDAGSSALPWAFNGFTGLTLTGSADWTNNSSASGLAPFFFSGGSGAELNLSILEIGVTDVQVNEIMLTIVRLA